MKNLVLSIVLLVGISSISTNAFARKVVNTSMTKNFEQMGVYNLNEVTKDLSRAGFDNKQVEKSLAAILRMVYVRNQTQQAYKLDLGMFNYLSKDLGLTKAQIATILETAERLPCLTCNESINK